MITMLFVLLVVFLVVSVPIAVSLGFSSLIVLKLDGIPLVALAQSIFETLDSFPLMAVPFFILAGNLMQTGGVSRRLVNLANALVGWIKGGLGMVVVMTSMFFSTLSGSSSATTAAIGSILIPAMEKKGYPKNFATAVTASSGELGVIIPPSIPMIIYALSANVSIGSLFIAGIIPGILIGISLMITIVIVSQIKGYDTVHKVTFSEWYKQTWKAFVDASLAILMPFIILGGIYLGWFTPTEAAVIAVVYGFVIGTLVYRELKWKDVLGIFVKSSITTAIIMLIVGFSSIFSFILTINQVPQSLGQSLTQISDSPLVFLLLVNILLFITGMFLETLAAIIILAPILAPVAIQFGIDPIHFGIVMIVNLAIGMVTPPVGVNLIVACQIAKLRIEQLTRPLLLFLAILIIDVLIITYVPTISTWLINI